MKLESHFKFFIVDDDYFYAAMHEQHLKNHNFSDVTHFENGKDCLDHLHLKPSIVFLDYNMNDLSGFEVLKKIKRYDPNIYVIMISGQENANNVVSALKYGAFDYLIKNDSVCDKITETLNKIIAIQAEINKAH